MNIFFILIGSLLNKFDAYCAVNVFNIVNFLQKSYEMNHGRCGLSYTTNSWSYMIGVGHLQAISGPCFQFLHAIDASHQLKNSDS